jgi:peptidoglycan/xylan/chitin deacetylase (PgdA/CDA1 family)
MKLGGLGARFAALSVIAMACSGAAPQGDLLEGDIAYTEQTAAALTSPRTVLPAPPMVLADVDLAAFRALPPRPSAVPVLLFHQICPTTCLPSDTYGTTQTEFARILMMLRAAGFTTIPMAHYEAALRGETSGLPKQPILVTFDDGRLDAYRGADAVLAALDAHATQFIITAFPEANAAAFMRWPEIAEAQASGRWDIQLHAHAGHSTVLVGPGTARSPFYANLAYDPVAHPTDGLESLAEWAARAEGDVAEGQRLLAARVPQYQPLAFALPYGDYGQFPGRSNDGRIAPSFRAFLGGRFAAWFTQPTSNPDFSTPNATREMWRYTVRNVTTADTIYAWLAAHSPQPSNDAGADASGDENPDASLDPSRAPLPVPTMVLSDSDRASFQPLAARSAVPVLLFHQICEAACLPADAYGISRTELARILLMLRAAGFATISMAQYEAFARGQTANLPAQPVLVTFDDGRLDAYRGADAILGALGARATQFVITANPQANAHAFMRWSEIASAQASGRWDIQLHAHSGHSTIASGSASARGPYYGNLAFDPVAWPTDSHLEALSDWRARVEGDLATGQSLLAARVPGYRPLAFAVPYGDYGQTRSNDARIAPAFREVVNGRFGCFFTQPYGNPDFSTPNTTHEAFRYTVKNGATADTVYAWLAARSPRPALRDAGGDSNAREDACTAPD